MSVFYKGVSRVQDPRFKLSDACGDWPEFVERGLRLAPARAEQFGVWVEARLAALLGREDEITANYIVCSLRDAPNDLRELWQHLQPLLGTRTAAFFDDLRAAAEAPGDAVGAAELASRKAAAVSAERAETAFLAQLLELLDEYAPVNVAPVNPRARRRRRHSTI